MPPLEEGEFGSQKRDWTFLWRAVTVALGGFTSIGVVVILYAGESYIKTEAAAAIFSEITPVRSDVKELLALPPRVKRLEEIAVDRNEVLRDYNQWRVRKDEIDTKLTVLLENQQKLLDRQQSILDNLARRQ